MTGTSPSADGPVSFFEFDNWFESYNIWQNSVQLKSNFRLNFLKLESIFFLVLDKFKL